MGFELWFPRFKLIICHPTIVKQVKGHFIYCVQPPNVLEMPTLAITISIVENTLCPNQKL
jgi:hypothetical protein